MNPTLRRIYQLVPSIGAWARGGVPGPLWATSNDALRGIQEYVGPRASPLFANSLHLDKEDFAFLRSPEAFAAIEAVVDAIYNHRPLIDGLLPEEVAVVQP